MLTSGENYPPGTTLTTQVCIVGSGPAAITLAWYLLAQGLEVILVEAGLNQGGNGLNRNSLLYGGPSSGDFTNKEPDFLVRPSYPGEGSPKERECVYGGTSTHWGGTCRPLDAGVFRGRPGFPAWPISRSDLDEAYAEACRFMKLYGPYYQDPRHHGSPGYNFTAEYWSTKVAGYQPLRLDGFEEAMYQIASSSVLQFQTRPVKGTTIGNSPAQVILNASLVGIAATGGSVQSLTVASLTSTNTIATQFQIRADVCVLACGAVENARQLLLAGLGGPTAGLYLMGHPIPIGGGGVSAYFGSNVTSDQYNLIQGNGVGPSNFGIAGLTARFQPYVELAPDLCRGRFYTNGGYYYELPPMTQTGVSLAPTTDVFGRAQSSANWNLGEVSERSYYTIAEMFKASLESLGGGASVTWNDWSFVAPRLAFNGHHIGTTRMSSTPADGVVDANLRVHGLDNLFVAGSSTFPSAGLSNPTLTIVALSIRLAVHLGLRFAKKLPGELGSGLVDT